MLSQTARHTVEPRERKLAADFVNGMLGRSRDAWAPFTFLNAKNRLLKVCISDSLQEGWQSPLRAEDGPHRGKEGCPLAGLSNWQPVFQGRKLLLLLLLAAA